MKKTLSLLLALVVALASFSTALADTGCIVQRGDTLYRIAARFGVSVQVITATTTCATPTSSLQTYYVQYFGNYWRGWPEMLATKSSARERHASRPEPAGMWPPRNWRSGASSLR